MFGPWLVPGSAKEKSRQARLPGLVDNMLAKDARKHEFETMPPRDFDIPDSSVMDTAFMSPENRRMRSAYLDDYARYRQLKAENRGLVRDYPEDYVMAATGVYGLGKGLTSYALKQAAKGKQFRHTANKIEDLFANMSQSQKAAMAAKPSKRVPLAKQEPLLDARLRQKYPRGGNLHEGMNIESWLKRKLAKENSDALKQYRLQNQLKRRDWQKLYGPKAGLDARKISNPGFSYDHIRRFGGPSANSVIPAAVLHQSMTE